MQSQENRGCPESANERPLSNQASLLSFVPSEILFERRDRPSLAKWRQVSRRITKSQGDGWSSLFLDSELHNLGLIPRTGMVVGESQLLTTVLLLPHACYNSKHTCVLLRAHTHTHYVPHTMYTKCKKYIALYIWHDFLFKKQHLLGGGHSSQVEGLITMHEGL